VDQNIGRGRTTDHRPGREDRARRANQDQDQDRTTPRRRLRPRRLFDLNGTVVTLDAMHTQTDPANLITAAGGDYVFTGKANLRLTDWDNIAACLRHHTRTPGSAIKLLLTC